MVTTAESCCRAGWRWDKSLAWAWDTLTKPHPAAKDRIWEEKRRSWEKEGQTGRVHCPNSQGEKQVRCSAGNLRSSRGASVLGSAEVKAKPWVGQIKSNTKTYVHVYMQVSAVFKGTFIWKYDCRGSKFSIYVSQSSANSCESALSVFAGAWFVILCNEWWLGVWDGRWPLRTRFSAEFFLLTTM